MELIDYRGRAAYCYSNSISMLLNTVREYYEADFIEPLTGVGLGAHINNDGLLFFSGLKGLPDRGLSSALDILGFEFKEGFSDTPDVDPFEILEKELASSKVIIGPLDMGHLTYMPGHTESHGADHFVLVYGLDEKYVHLHDPHGYPHMVILRDELKKAWEAKNIGYKRGYYRFWSSPERVSRPTDSKLREHAIQTFKERYKEVGDDDSGALVDGAAIDVVKNQLLQGTLDDRLFGHFVYFALPLGAKRAMDYAMFFASVDYPISQLKYEQSQWFGRAHAHVQARRYKEAAEAFDHLSTLTESIKQSVLKLSFK